MNLNINNGIQSTAGAILIRNEKGEISMQKVKVRRYISGKRPEYAQGSSSEVESDVEGFIDIKKEKSEQVVNVQHNEDGDKVPREDESDSRLKRLRVRQGWYQNNERQKPNRHIHDPELLLFNDSEHEEEESTIDENSKKITLESDSESDMDLSDREIEIRRQMLRERMLRHERVEEILQKEDEGQSEISDSEVTEFEDDSGSEGDNEPRLKPLFVKRRDRATVIEKEKEATKQKQVEADIKKISKERRRHTLRMIEDSMKKDMENVKLKIGDNNLNDVCTDEENDEIEYEAWKLRELKRIKRDREEKDLLVREQMEIERMRNMTDDERRVDLRQNPKVITNKALKGKYKFLQKYYHRGAFYLDAEDEVLKRDFAQATLEDHFDKTILPKVMQVKNFGRCGRTKYTHLVDQDTTQFDSPWYSDSASNIKFHNERAGGVKQLFSKPSLSKRKITQNEKH